MYIKGFTSFHNVTLFGSVNDRLSSKVSLDENYIIYYRDMSTIEY